MKKIALPIALFIVFGSMVLTVFFFFQSLQSASQQFPSSLGNNLLPSPSPIPSFTTMLAKINPSLFTIAQLRSRTYLASDITIEQTLPAHENYTQYLVSYLSDGLKIHALLTIPKGQKPAAGWPVILFNHGYIDPQTYVTNGNYIPHVDFFAKNGYIVFKPDYRGHGKSEGVAEGGYYDSGYVIDDLNALAAIKKYPAANPSRIGVWAHSMGGSIALHDLIITHDFKAAVIWGGVVGSYTDLIYNWERKVPFQPKGTNLTLRKNYQKQLLNQFGTPQQNPFFWNAIDPTAYISDITTPVQLDVGGSDEEVPIDFSKTLRDKLQANGKTVEYYEYPHADHNISQGYTPAIQHSLEFFDKYLKN